MLEEVCCRRITNDVGYKNVALENSLRVNSDIDYRRKAPESQEVQQLIPLSEPISSSQRKFMRESSGGGDNNCSGLMCTESVESNEVGIQNLTTSIHRIKHGTDFPPNCESSGKHAVDDRPSSSNYDSIQYVTTLYSSRLRPSLSGKLSASASDEDDMSGLMENHQEFIHVMKSRLTKLEVVYRCWQRNDIKGSIDATSRTLDFAVCTTDIVNALMENRNCITLDVCASLLRLTASLLESTYDRHMSIALGMILSLVKSFGSTISSALSATPPVGVDLEAEQRLERCNLCFQELKNVSASLKLLTRRQGEVGRSAQELNLFLQDIFQLSSV
ncbi:unnamed protein product [Miscanthus lutarioriparius]|uniref:Katanin p80 subunit C-terminal domain-containing protein n=1 Tax=Miscanthus lutarioriparius TaxID=422564 RepID=A0A811MF97_9POAL|nr:unnamed protein product [Miscanthus lutarioriparius]